MSVCLSVCLSVKSRLTSGASVRPEISATYSAGNEGQQICGVFSKTAEKFCHATSGEDPLPKWRGSARLTSPHGQRGILEAHTRIPL